MDTLTNRAAEVPVISAAVLLSTKAACIIVVIVVNIFSGITLISIVSNILQ